MESDATDSVGTQSTGEAIPVDDEAVAKILTDNLAGPLTETVDQLTKLLRGTDPSQRPDPQPRPLPRTRP